MTKIINRKCIVCLGKLRIKVYEDKHYKGGHYFNKMKVPIGKGEYKQISTTKLGRRKIKVVKWTGKEKEIEYWECNKCYEEGYHESWLEDTIKMLFGSRCKTNNKNCTCCQAWDVYDSIIKYNRKKL